MDRPIRILHVLGRLDRGGAETMVMNIFRNIDRDQIQFDFVKHTEDDCAYDKEIKLLGGKIYSIPRYNFLNQISYKRAWKCFFSNHPEYKIIHGHMRSTASLYLKIAKKYGLVTIAHSHSTSNGKGLPAKVKNILQLSVKHEAEQLLACSKEAGTWLYGDNVIREKNFHIVKNAIDTQKFTFNQNNRLKVRKDYNIENKFVIGHIGRFSEPKNHTYLIDVFFEVSKKNNEAILLLIGDGELMDKIKTKVNRLGIRDKVIFTGSKSDISGLLQAMDVFLFPSLYEGLGIVTIEAQATGLPCIVSDKIPHETQITSLIKYLELNKPAVYWANEILDLKNKYIRKGEQKVISDAGYDINDTVKWIQNFYFHLNEQR